MLLPADQVRLEPVYSGSSDPKCFKSLEQNCVVEGCRQVQKDQCSQVTGVDHKQDVRQNFNKGCLRRVFRMIGRLKLRYRSSCVMCQLC